MWLILVQSAKRKTLRPAKPRAHAMATGLARFTRLTPFAKHRLARSIPLQAQANAMVQETVWQDQHRFVRPSHVLQQRVFKLAKRTPNARVGTFASMAAAAKRLRVPRVAVTANAVQRSAAMEFVARGLVLAGADRAMPLAKRASVRLRRQG